MSPIVTYFALQVTNLTQQVTKSSEKIRYLIVLLRIGDILGQPGLCLAQDVEEKKTA